MKKLFEASAGYAQHSILKFPLMPSFSELGQRLKRNPNLNSAKSHCAAQINNYQPDLPQGTDQKENLNSKYLKKNIKKQTFKN
ncbi:MAG: hypothetical protein LIO50_03800 [Phascolarctobacterium sp.]|uniref:hypothetical protein n=1 Tax=Phascolarctobacterium sp. TaxID=2049039 RepID=UPI0025D4A156|nr:hypothetical protein [Phascolarctobacterium sp.]MCC8158332.1 hypothetical protein [Phascolarctobacterium sp.]